MVMASPESLDGEINRALEKILSFLAIARIGLLTVDERSSIGPTIRSFSRGVPWSWPARRICRPRPRKTGVRT